MIKRRIESKEKEPVTQEEESTLKRRRLIKKRSRW
jgi:hypothetical protein